MVGLKKTKSASTLQSTLNNFVKGGKMEKKKKVDDVAAQKDEEVMDVDDEDEVAQERDPKILKKLSPDQSDLPPINKIPHIFTDIVRRTPDLKKVAQHLKGRKLRVATMCSGTESPLLALGMISDAMRELYGVKLEVDHVFSCEIEPFKQAYIERNFSPPILFRDVCELGGDTATTAYGAKVKVPGNVDILIAGTSCVDYSNLNNEKQDLDANGESGRTFRGMMSWVTKHRPALVILENVCSAPWSRICDYFRKNDYSADHMRVDTKLYYIPHTRTRGYLIAMDAKNSGKAAKWKETLIQLQRPASSTLDAFLLPSDDPRIHNAREKLVQESKAALDRRREKIDWARCENRHSRARAEEELGNKRPLTSWSEGGGIKMLDFMWSDWGSVQVERVWDLMDITLLRRAKLGIDPSFKTQVWNLSQNVDRQIDSNRVGIAPCLTPTMIPYITNRGGPMVGLEALSLQGLPIDTLLLTRETQDQLADLAGNAMSTTVVGSGIIAALMVGRKLLVAGPDCDDEDEDMEEDIGDRKPLVTDRIEGDEKLDWNPLHLLPLKKSYGLEGLLDRAKASARLCECEGRNGTTDRPLTQCIVCDHTSCSKCGGRPEHVTETLHRERISPSIFSAELKAALPMCISFSSISEDTLEELRKKAGYEQLSTEESSRWKIWKAAVLRAVSEDAQFIELKRGEEWVVTYKSRTAMLELTLHPLPGRPEWRFIAYPLIGDPASALSRKILIDAVARLICTGSDLLSGTWDFALPFPRASRLKIQGCGEKVPSYLQRLGLQGDEYRTTHVYSQLEVSWDEEDMELAKVGIDKNLSGKYSLLDKCGTANSALHRQVDGPQSRHGDNRTIYLFLDPTRTGDPQDDSFVFSKSKKRLDYLESRDVIARLDASWKQPGWNEGGAVSQSIECTIPYIWSSCDELSVKASKSGHSRFAVPKGVVETKTEIDACANAQALLSCEVAIKGEPSAHWPKDKWLQVDQVHEFEIFKAIAYFVERVKHVNQDVQKWHHVDLLEHPDNCERCAPMPPALKWVRVDKKVRAIEDASQAGRYEQALKNRPAPFVTHIKYDSDKQLGLVKIGVNLTSLMHRAFSRLPSVGRSEPAELSWHLNTDFTPQAAIDLHKFTLKSNRPDPPAKQPPHFKESVPLRPEQLRSLYWMKRQEADDSPMFVEEEITEAMLPTLGWRAQGKAQRSVRVRGGVLADQVGYGKTAITLGLIDATHKKAKRLVDELEDKEFPGHIPVKATLVVVPPHLTRQWGTEVSKFTGKHFEVVTIHTASQLNQVTIADIESADIVVVASNLFHSDVYLKNLEAFAAGEELPPQEGRYFNARLLDTLESLKQQVDLLKSEGAAAVLKAIREANERNIKLEADFVQTKRLKGKQYRDAAGKETETTEQSSTDGGATEATSEDEKPKPKSKKKPQPSKSKRVVKSKQVSDSDSDIVEIAPPKPSAPSSEPEKKRKLTPVVVLKKLSTAEEKRYAAMPRAASGDEDEMEVDNRSSDDDVKVSSKGKKTVRPKRISKAKGKRKSIIISDDEYGKDDDDDFEVASDASSSDASEGEHTESEGSASESDDSLAPRKKKATKTNAKPYKPPRKQARKASLASEEDDMEVDESAKPSNGKVAKKGGPKSKKRKSAEPDSDDEPPKKKAKKETKPKPKRADADPWKLGGSKTKSDYTSMHAPPLEMFRFNRLVIDEFTYLKGKGQSLVNNLQSINRWILSGTPPIQDFASVKSIANFLGLHLGVDDDGEGTKETMAKRRREQTAVEKFHSFREVRTLEWHQHRQTVGQRFLDQFVRQNIAEIDEIPFKEIIEPVHLPAAERAIYLELEHHLRALDMTIKKAKKSESDRERRLNKSLGDSQSAEEALLKRCSHFDLEATKENAMKACQSIVEEREEQLEQCRKELLKQLKTALSQQKNIRSKAGKLSEESYFEAFVRSTQTEGHGENESTAMIIDIFKEAGLELTHKPLETVTNLVDKGGLKQKIFGKPGKPANARGKQSADDNLPSAVKDLIWEHREHTHELRRLVKELVARKRSLRFFTAVRDLQRDQNQPSSTEVSYDCPRCERKELPTEEIGVLSGCGHLGCLTCIKECTTEKEACIAEYSEGCKSLSRIINIVEAQTLGVDDEERDGRGKHFGRKLEMIIDLIKNRIPDDERVLVFVQFDGLMKKVGEAFNANKIKYLEIRGSASQKSKALESFQQDSKERVLLLHVTDESASGANLTGSNHAVFLSPLLTNTRENYDAYMTQAVGRLRRFGQLKLVHIYHFLSKDTIDMDIFEGRTGKKAVV